MENRGSEDRISFLRLLFESGEKSDEFQQKITDFFPAIVYVYDPSKKQLLYINKKVTEFLGYSIQDLSDLDNDLNKCVFEEDLTMVEEELKKFHDLPDNDCLSYKCRLNHKLGNWRYFRTQGTVLRRNENGSVASILFVAQDITEQIQHEEECLALKDYKLMMLDRERFLNSGSWEYDLNTKKMTWSEGKFRLFGYDPEQDTLEIDDKKELFRKHLTEEDRENGKTIWKDFIQRKNEYTWEFDIIAKDGRKKKLETYARVIRDQNGKAQKVIGSSRDITQIREYEESLKEKIEELDRSNKELEEFAYIASHDLQEPLRKITSFSERLKEKAGNKLGPDSIIYLDRMLTATDNMRVLIDNLLEFSRTSRHSQPFKRTDLNKILLEVKADLELKVEENNAHIQAEPLPTLEAIPSQMRQLFNNLLVNAIKFRKPEDPPVITIQSSQLSKKEKEDFRYRSNKTYYKIQIKDNGIGFEQQYALKIFQIFQRLHGKTEYPGSGIGLAICKKIVDNHNGLIYAHSEPNTGAEFTIVLPDTQP